VKAIITIPWAERLGGAEEMLYTFLERCDQDRVDAHVILLSEGPLAADVARLGHRVTVLPAGRLRHIARTAATVVRLSRILQRERPDVILNWTTKTHYYGTAAATLVGMRDRLMWWQHGIPLGHWMDRFAGRLPAVAIGCSSQAAAQAQKAVAPSRRTFVVYPGITASVTTDPAETREKWDIPPDRQVIGIVGRLQPWKGQHVLLHAIAALRADGKDVHGLIVGGNAYNLSPEYEQSLLDLVSSLGLEDCVTMTGHVPDASGFFDLMDVLVCASAGEPFGIALIEAMRAGLPVVSTASGGPAEIVRHGESGLLVRERTPEAFAQALGVLLDDRQAMSRMGAVGRELVNRHFRAEVMTERLERSLTAVSMRHL
jgi:glycosyltransferase involved in cell wall biosynthesis